MERRLPRKSETRAAIQVMGFPYPTYPPGSQQVCCLGSPTQSTTRLSRRPGAVDLAQGATYTAPDFRQEG